MITSHTDWRGNVIEVGDTVLYPAQSGSSAAHLVEGVVLGFDEGPESYSYMEGRFAKPDRMRVAPTRRSDFGQWDGRPVVILSSLRHVVKAAP